MKRASAIALAVGLGLAIGVIAWVGAGTLMDSISIAGWRVTLLAPIFLPWLLLAGWSWRLLLPRAAPVRIGSVVVIAWIALGIAWLAPLGQIGGEVVKAAWARKHGVPGAAAVASVVADKTVQLGTQIALAIVGVALLAWLSSDTSALVGAGVGLGVFTLAVVGFMIAQARGLFRASVGLVRGPLKRFTSDSLHEDATRVDQAVRAVYRDRRRIVLSALTRLGFRLGFAVETYLALRLLGHDIGPAQVLAIESLAQAVRAGAFLIPAGLGVQEGAFVALAVALGIPAPVGLAVSVCKRARELLVGVPALVAWQVLISVRSRGDATD